MSGSAITTRAQIGLDAPPVTVETHLPGGLPGFTVVGMPETAVREARDRVKSAIQTCGFEFPRGRVIVNLAPAELAKEGSRYDLAIAASILCATRQLPYRSARNFEYLAELSLFGELRPARGALCAALAGTTPVVLAPADAAAARQIGSADAWPLAHLSELKQLLAHADSPEAWWQRHTADLEAQAADVPLQATLTDCNSRHPASERPAPEGEAQEHQGELPELQQEQPDRDPWRAILGQEAAKRALLIAASGGHHLLFVGPPGTGKSLLARSLIKLLPPLGVAELREVAAIYSAAGYTISRSRPFREPHHSASAVALVGGGRAANAGEISLAHRGVLFLDELPHFAPSVLDLLREPLSLGRIGLARASYRVTYPASFQLIAAMNPCPSGFTCTPERCRCSPARVRSYQGRISGPLLDRIDLQIAVPPVTAQELLAPLAQQEPARKPTGKPKPSAALPGAIVARARARQVQRQGGLNAAADPALALAKLGPDARQLLESLANSGGLSARSQHRLLNVARTIADMSAVQEISTEHLAEAFALRQLDWEGGLGTQAG